jgi:hypothetical protein
VDSQKQGSDSMVSGKQPNSKMTILYIRSRFSRNFIKEVELMTTKLLPTCLSLQASNGPPLITIKIWVGNGIRMSSMKL